MPLRPSARSAPSLERWSLLLRAAEFEAETDRPTCGVTKAHRSPRGWLPVRVDNAHSGQRRPCLLLRSFGPFHLELRFHLQRRACKSLVRTEAPSQEHGRTCASTAPSLRSW